MRKITSKEKEAILQLFPFKRYTYTLKRIADQEVVFCLQQEDGTWALSELDNQVLLSIWPHAEFAQDAVDSEWKDCHVVEIPLVKFTDSVLPLLGNNPLINVFGISDRSGFVVNQQEFRRDLKDELAKY